MNFSHDEANRLSQVFQQSAVQAIYSYDAANQRIYASVSTTVNNVYTTSNYIYFYGADGKKLGVWQSTTPNNTYTLTLVTTNLWFGGRLTQRNGVWTNEDRLQSIGKYFPYGEDRYNPTPANPSNDQEKFATYTRDSISGLDYALNRYYSAGIGRFMSADPYQSRTRMRQPQGWNRYPYTPGDPLNYNDPKGLAPACESTGLDCGCDPDDPCWCDPGGEHIGGLHFVSSFRSNDCGPGGPGGPPEDVECDLQVFAQQLFQICHTFTHLSG